MMFLRKLLWPVVSLALLLASVEARSEIWPRATTRLIVPFAPGSTPDGLARLLTERLQARLGTTFVVENRPGASGNTGTDAVAKAEPDGATLGLSIVGPLVLNKLLFKALPYDPDRDLAPILLVAEQPSVLVVSNELDVRDVAELMTLLKRDGARLNYGSIGHGSLSHLAMAAFAAASGASPQHVAYSGSPNVVTALVRNDVQLAVLPAGSVVPQARAGLFAMLAATGENRSSLIPEVPTLRESGIAGIDANAWVGLIGPAKLPPLIEAAIRDAVIAILAEPATRERLAALYLEPIGSSSDGFRTLMQEELTRWKPVIEAQGIRME